MSHIAPEPRESDAPGHLLLVRGGRIDAIREALEPLGLTVDSLPVPVPPADAARPGEGTRMIRVGRLVLDPDGHEAWYAGTRVNCTPTEFALLSHLAERPGQVLSRRQLLRRIRGSAEFMTERTIDSHIGNLRRKLDAGDGAPPLVVTVYGVGYKLRAERPRLGAVHRS